MTEAEKAVIEAALEWRQVEFSEAIRSINNMGEVFAARDKLKAAVAQVEKERMK